jgi:N-acetylglucosamine kinase-like BadF-type ATPase
VSLTLDGRGEPTRLQDKLAANYQWRTRQDLIKAVYQDKFELSRLAPLVLEAAGENDVLSQRILQHAAALLADQVRAVVMHMGILRKIALVMLGGLVDHENVYSNTLHMKLLKVLPQVDVRPPMHSPAHGAVLMALELLRKR